MSDNLMSLPTIEFDLEAYEHFPVGKKLKKLTEFPAFTVQSLEDWVMSMDLTEMNQRTVFNSNGADMFLLDNFYGEVVKDFDSRMGSSFLRLYDPKNRHVDLRENEIVSKIIVGASREGMTTHHVVVTEENLEDYKGLPPLHIDKAVGQVKDQFDSVVILDVNKTEILIDPIACGKIKELPDTYFFICGWLEDIKLFDHTKKLI